MDHRKPITSLARFARLASLALFALAAPSLSACANLRVAPGAATIDAIPIALAPQSPSIETVGPLVYRGGLYLHARNQDFGGFSGLVVSEDGARVLAISDKGNWWTGKLDYNDGRLSNFTGARMTAMRGANGEAYKAKDDGDCESVTSASTEHPLAGPFYVGFERKHRIALYPNPYTLDGLSDVKAVPTPVNVPAAVTTQPANGGIEALTLLDADTLLAFSEQKVDANGYIAGWLISAHGVSGKQFGDIWLKPLADFRPSDMALLPDGDVLVLERKFSLSTGAAMQLRRLARAEIKPGARLEGIVIARLDVSYSIDNMEGLAVRKDAATGETLIYLISDDNFNGLQRTVLLSFALKE